MLLVMHTHAGMLWAGYSTASHQHQSTTHTSLVVCRRQLLHHHVGLVWYRWLMWGLFGGLSGHAWSCACRAYQ